MVFVLVNRLQLFVQLPENELFHRRSAVLHHLLSLLLAEVEVFEQNLDGLVDEAFNALHSGWQGLCSLGDRLVLLVKVADKVADFLP